ncbi:MAG: methylaspartate ammonia-lyase [Defluviitaleaceae bacterium]|nr:methylaspartate ammonia-lyase [Defluviitaleaceae bacterium]
MKITKIICSPGMTGFFFDDQKAIKEGAVMDGSTYKGEPVTDGFRSVRQKGESVSVMLVLEDGQIAYGDCAAVQYSGAGGRDPLFLAQDFIPIIEREIVPLLVNREITTFREMAELVDKHIDSLSKKPMHTAIRYGVSQAVLDAVAKANKKLMTQVVAEEYGLKLTGQSIPIFSQSGDERYQNSDKMILKYSDVLPHALINNVAEKLGDSGEKLAEYVEWLRKRILSVRMDGNYSPVLHIDVYGTLGIAFDNDFPRIADYMCKLADIAKPFKLRIEGPVDMGEREKQIDALAKLREMVEAKDSDVEIVADEWCNTYEDVVDFTDRRAGHMAQIKTPDLGGINNSIEAVLYCKKHGMGAYLGGTCNETDRSAAVCVHIALATLPDQMLAKPGMGVDEGYMIVYNEMQRTLSILKGV